MPKISRKVLLSLLFVVASTATTVLLIGEETRVSSQSGIRIISPSDGAFVSPGQMITVKLDIGTNTNLKLIVGGVVQKSAPSQSLSRADSLPFDLQLRIPDSALGPATINVLALDQKGNRFEASVEVIIQGDVLPQALVVPEEYKSVALGGPGSSSQLLLLADFSGGLRRDITRSPNTHYSSENARIASVDPNGNIRGNDFGRTVVTVTYGSLSALIPVRVGVFELRGDLDGDGDIDNEDLKILQAAIGTHSSGVDDPRDINGDGLIDDLDSALLLSMCSRPECIVSLGPMIDSVSFDGRKNITIQGTKFGSSPRVLINALEKQDFIKSLSDTIIKLKGKAKKLGLTSGDNTVQIIDQSGARSNVFRLTV